jgi:transposase
MHVAMERSGMYCKLIYHLIEGLGLIVLVVNAQHIKAVPSSKTDVKDAEWIAELMQHGLSVVATYLSAISRSIEHWYAISRALSNNVPK